MAGVKRPKEPDADDELEEVPRNKAGVDPLLNTISDIPKRPPPFPFLALPTEIRIMIYDQLLNHTRLRICGRQSRFRRKLTIKPPIDGYASLACR
ncbi:uncharacterized protein BDZ99DRAFT_527287 [Mytilinidion resinicola]|uniref:Uncharacterized protein n=1 Tax=Mytilinidion resinicola TaxID=574789 RepID=A0A6A6Y180_9PEZI|nr:uncharacterized protein BDZ99DRAFT_527287 [Mytilinidion resinicola]KAF2802561.1 hypothetical protein BDZ99DRAFT_527287 [Mytilinidion resinicola]